MRFFVILILLPSLYSFSQKIDYSNFDHNILQSKLLSEVSQFRRRFCLDSLTNSNTLKRHTSDKLVNLNSTKDSLYVVTMETINDSINQLLFNEIKNYNFTPTDIFIEKTSQVILVIFETYDTYDELANYIMKKVLKSGTNFDIMTSQFLDNYRRPGLVSCSSRFSESGNLYISINFVKLGYF